MFPTADEKNRSRAIADNFSLYKGEFGKVLRYFRTQKERLHQIEVIQNVAGKLSRSFAFLMFTEEVGIRHPDKTMQQNIDDFIFRNQLHNKLDESALTQSYAGVTYFEMYLQDGLTFINELDPANVYPQYDSMYAGGEPLSVIISWEPTIGGQPCRFIKTHTPGLITYELRKISVGGEDQGTLPLSMLDPTLPDYETTGLDYIPVYQINNVKTGRDIFGSSDYEDLRSLFTELTRNQSQVATQLKKHGDARMAVPPGVLDENGQWIKDNDEVFEVRSESGSGGDGVLVPQYIVNQNPQLDQLFNEQEKLVEAIARVADISTLLMDWNVSGGAEKVGALRLRLAPTLAKVKRKLRPYNRGIADIIIDAMAWQGSGQIVHTDLSLEFSDGLPKDSLEDAQVETTRYAAGLQTMEDAIRNLDGLQGEALQAKLAALKEEDATKTANAMSGIPSFSMTGGGSNQPAQAFSVAGAA